MTCNELVDLAVDAWHGAITAFCHLQPQGSTKEGARGTRIIISGTPVADLNAVISMTRQPDIAEVSAFAAILAAAGLPWSIQVRSDSFYPDIAEVATKYGLTKSFRKPFMIKQMDNDELTSPINQTIDVRRVPKEDHDVYNSVLAAGYEAPEHVFRGFSAPKVLNGHGMTAYMAEDSETPVATSFGALVDHHVGVFNVATRPAYRRRGAARAATAKVLKDAYAQGARTAFLHSTPAGLGLYKSLGFRIVEEWLVFIAP
jgi:ribosomal protein S18 acetylase RimI-like enzyme